MDSIDPQPPASKPRRHLAAGAALSTIAEIGPFAAAGVLSVVLARAIGPSGNGAFALIATTIGITTLVFSLGLAAGITYEVSREHWSARRAWAQTGPLALVLGLAGTAAGLGFYLLTRHTILREISIPVAAIAFAALPAFLAWQFAAAILLGRDRYEHYALLQLSNSGAMLVTAPCLAVLFGLTGAVVGLAASAMIAAVAGAVLVIRHVPRDSELDHSCDQRESKPLRRAFRFGLTAWTGNILQQVNYRFDVMILAAYASASHVGVYSIALTLTSIAWFLPHGIQTVIFPRAANLDAATQASEVPPEESDSAVARGARHSVLLLVPSASVVALLLALVPLIYGSRFDETVPLGFVLLPGVLALGVGKVLASVVAGRGAVRYNLYTSALAAGITLGLYFWMIPAYGEWGAAVASSISYLATAIIALAFFRRQLRIPLSDVLVPTVADLRNYPEAFAALTAHMRSRRARGYAA